MKKSTGFNVLEGDFVVLSSKGVFQQVPVYEWQGGLFAKAKGGYIRLNADGSTSHPDVSQRCLCSDVSLFKDRFGRLCTDASMGEAVRVGNDGKIEAQIAPVRARKALTA
ncbi:hypothetical protein [Paracoccus sp. MKU1]|uniref:hypothetical protein n=1 Tax=Paracoccus sp. MKU1 TaxID=1745182 RepID=UPI00071935D0|nr:hypothetical protein [Paracoccus sp. MKU1]KRW94324.1 hypothetical protein AQY21_20560 [Paracoccus sp. MKU1]